MKEFRSEKGFKIARGTSQIDRNTNEFMEEDSFMETSTS